MHQIHQKNYEKMLWHKCIYLHSFVTDKINTDKPWVTQPSYTAIQQIYKRHEAKTQ